MTVFRLTLLLLVLAASGASAQDFVGSPQCGSCHEEAFTGWQQSHHRHAMEPANEEAVLGNFNDATFDYFGKTSRFFREGEDFMVETDNAAGNAEVFRIAYTFGWYPLQQYLIEMEDGRLQTLSISWDSRPEDSGGQRWYHLYPDEEITSEDPLHWTGAFQNWNSRCASCHSTDLQKNYSMEADTYDTQWAEISVGCEACHGPGSAHVAWANGDTEIPDQGLANDIAAVWQPEGSQLPIPEHDGRTISDQVQLCAGCHSRRGELQQRNTALSYFENYALSPLLEGLYYPDGQMLDEVYVTGSFLQSRMHANQVSCSNCHEPHTSELRIQGNGLCLQCHQAETFETPSHYFHPPGSEGAQCINCHMTATTYMGVDDRRDHSFRIPDPLASLIAGVPNACTGCHTDRDDSWAAAEFTAHTGRTEPVYPHTKLLAGARDNQADIASELHSYAEDESRPSLLRGIALIESARFPGIEHMGALLQGLSHPDPLLRAQAAAATVTFDDTTRLEYLAPLMTDTTKAVRMAAARQLTAIPATSIPLSMRNTFVRLLEEYETALLFNADMPESMSDLGSMKVAQGDLQEAEQLLLHARQLSPGFLPASLNLADVYRAQGRDGLGETVLNEALGMYPDSGDVNYALGLLYVRTGRTADSVFLFRRASTLAEDNPQYTLVYAISLAETGRTGEAIAVLENALQRFPGNASITDALRAYRSAR